MNLLEPLNFDDAAIDAFVRDHACALCLGHLLKRPAKGRRWLAYCPHCGPILKHNHVRKADAAQHINGCRVALRELTPPSGKSETELLHDLGY